MKNNKQKIGFTLVEILVVVVILAIAAAMAVPMFSGAAGFQTQSAANMIAADLEYAKSMAISRQQYYGVVFDTGAELYKVVDANGNVIEHPVKKGFVDGYTIKFRADSRLNQVDLAIAPSNIYFDYLGSPYSKSGATMTALNAQGKIKVAGGGKALYVYVTPVTGYIRISDVDE